jgi:hypothetical protein
LHAAKITAANTVSSKIYNSLPGINTSSIGKLLIGFNVLQGATNLNSLYLQQ